MKLPIMFLLGLSSSLALAGTHEKPPKTVIGMEKAKLTALETAPGKIEGSELEFEKNQWLYSFDIRGKDRKIHEIQVNAISGAVVGNDIETHQDEKREAAEDAGKKL